MRQSLVTIIVFALIVVLPKSSIYYCVTGIPTNWSNENEGFRFSLLPGPQESFSQVQHDGDIVRHSTKTTPPTTTNHNSSFTKTGKSIRSWISKNDRSNPKEKNEKRRLKSRYTLPKSFIGDNVPTLQTRQENIEKRGQRGRITCDVGTYSTMSQRSSINGTAFANIEEHHELLSKFDEKPKPYISSSNYVKKSAKVRVSIDPSAVNRFFPIIFIASSNALRAAIATIRLLPPLVISRRVLLFVYYLIGDYMTGRYFRKTYSRVERAYIHYYETPATFRALSRTVSQLAVYLILAKVMGWLVGVTHKPCRSEGRGLAFICGLLWTGSVVGSGHAFSTAVALWGGPLRLQSGGYQSGRSWKNIFSKPWHHLQLNVLINNPEDWINAISSPILEPFDPNPTFFPITWTPLRLLQLFAMAKVATTEPGDYFFCSPDKDHIPKLMKHYFIQLSLCDEWHRVFLGERRVGLGAGVAVVYLLAMLSFMSTSASMNGTFTLLMVPSLLGTIISVWMNIIIFFNRQAARRGRPFQNM